MDGGGKERGGEEDSKGGKEEGEGNRKEVRGEKGELPHRGTEGTNRKIFQYLMLKNKQIAG